VLGWEVNDAGWEESLKYALENCYVVQQRVDVGSESYPSVVEDRLVFGDRYFDLDPYVWSGQDVEGCGVRLSRSALLNVSAGGGSGTPLFILQN
jgi:hypothetical protein